MNKKYKRLNKTFLSLPLPERKLAVCRSIEFAEKIHSNVSKLDRIFQKYFWYIPLVTGGIAGLFVSKDTDLIGAVTILVYWACLTPLFIWLVDLYLFRVLRKSNELLVWLADYREHIERMQDLEAQRITNIDHD